MATRLKYMLLVLLLVTLGGGMLGCEPGYRHPWYGDPYYGSSWGRWGSTPWGSYGPYRYGDEQEWHHHHHHDHDDDD